MESSRDLPSKEREIETKNVAATLRTLLKDWVTNSNIDVVLFGENHGASITDDTILANIDLFVNSKRRIVFIVEGLKQNHSKILLNSAAKKSIKNLKKLDISGEAGFDVLLMAASLLKEGIEIYGPENTTSNPFINEEINENNQENAIRYAESKERLINSNEEFAKYINEQKSALVFFVGGSAHPVALKKIEEGQPDIEMDSGMKGRIKGNCTTLRIEKRSGGEDKQILTENEPYSTEQDDQTWWGTYDYHLRTKSQELYLDAFNDYETKEGKAELLFLFLNSLYRASYSGYYPQRVETKLRYILGALDQSLGNQLNPYASIKQLFNQHSKNFDKVHNTSNKFFGKKSVKDSGFKKKLQAAINEDLKLKVSLNLHKHS